MPARPKRHAECTEEAFSIEAELIGKSRSMCLLREQIRQATRSRSTVLITGETGTGKGLVARSIHRASLASHQPWVHLDCSAIAASMIESELFGHERGAFTGATRRRPGRLELAQEGTLFLDEIAEIPPRLQAKFLRALQDRSYERVGGTETLPVRARVIAATNRDIEAAVDHGRFRSDLYYRLNVLRIYAPPLREHPEDIPLLVKAAVRRSCAELGISEPEICAGFYAVLQAHAWPGNVRELMNVVERSVVQSPGARLDASSLRLSRARGPDPVSGDRAHAGASQTNGNAQGPAALVRLRHGFRAVRADATERERIATVLRATGGNVSRTARRLGVSRSTLRYRIAAYGLQDEIPSD